MHKGTIVLVPFPFTDLSGQKVRPALVLHDSRGGEDFIVAFISSVPKGNGGLFDLKISPSVPNGLKAESHIKLDKIATLQKKISVGVLGELETSHMKKVDILLKKLLGL